MLSPRRPHRVPTDRTSAVPVRTCLLGLLIVVTLVAPVCVWGAEIVYSRLADRSNAIALDGTTLEGLIYVTVSGARGSATVDFYIDDPGLRGSPVRVDSSKPFDLFGGSRHSAEAWDLASLSKGPHTVTAVLKTKNRSKIAQAAFTVSGPEPTNSPPSVQNIAPQSTAEGQMLSFTVSATDPDGDYPSLQAEGLPSGATFTPGSDGKGLFQWAPGYLAAGNYTVSFVATDAVDPNVFDSVEVSIVVNDTNRPPSLAPIEPQTVEAGQTLSVSVSATDPDGPAPVIAIQGMPSGTMFTDNGEGIGTLLWDTTYNDVGDHAVGFVASDAGDSTLTDSAQMAITVTEAPNSSFVTLIWDPNPPAELLLGYKVFFGPSVETALVQISELFADIGDVDLSDPFVTYNLTQDLGLQAGDLACFRVSAFNAAGESGLSEPACM